jgi:hypothetical protein
MSDDTVKLNEFENNLKEMYKNIILNTIDEDPNIRSINTKELSESYVVDYLVIILRMIDIHGQCKKYIDKINPNISLDSRLILDWSSGIGCSKIKGIFDCFKSDVVRLDINENLKTKITEYIKEQINNPKNTSDQTSLLKNLLDLINDTDIPVREKVIDDFRKSFKGGNINNIKIKKTVKKEILGKERCIYKKSGDRKEYLKHKGGLITVSEYKKLMKSKK